MGKPNPHIRFVGSLVLRESDITVHPHQRTPDLSGLGHEVRRDGMYSGSHGPDEGEGWFQHLFLVTAFVGLEPVSLVVL